MKTKNCEVISAISQYMTWWDCS